MTWRSEPSRRASRRVPRELEAPSGHLVEGQDLATSVGSQAVDVADRRLLGLAKVRHEGARGLDFERGVINAEPPQRGRAEVLEQGLAGLVGREVPRGADRQDEPGMVAEGANPGGFEAQLRDQGLRRVEPSDLVAKLGAQDGGELELAGRELDPRQAELASRFDDGRQVVGGPGVEQLLVGQGARGDDPHDLAFDQPLGESGVLNLLADRGALTGLNQPGQIRIERGVGKSGHRYRVRALVTGRQRQAQQRGGAFGVLAEHLVEVAHPKQQQRVRVTRLELAILLHHRRQRRFAHRASRRRKLGQIPAKSEPAAARRQRSSPSRTDGPTDPYLTSRKESPTSIRIYRARPVPRCRSQTPDRAG